MPCSCVGVNYDPLNSCCPTGFSTLESVVHNDVVMLTTSLRRKRLQQEPGDAVILGKFYDTAIFPSVDDSENPSRRWCAPGPGMYEQVVEDRRKSARVCAGEGTVRNRGVKTSCRGHSGKYNPQFCADLGSDADGLDYWKPSEKVLWYTYPKKVILSELGDHTSSMAYTENGVTIKDTSSVDVPPPYTTADYTFEQFANACKSQCAHQACSGIVIREDSAEYDCFVATHVFIGAPHFAVHDALPRGLHGVRKQRQPEFCENVDDPSKTCVGCGGLRDRAAVLRNVYRRRERRHGKPC